MPGTRTQDKDVISRIADSGEDALRRLVDLPRRIVVQAVDDVDERLHDLATKVREIDPLYRRVIEIERRLDALEKAKRTSSAERPPAPGDRRLVRRASPPHSSRSAAVLKPETSLRRAGEEPRLSEARFGRDATRVDGVP